MSYIYIYMIYIYIYIYILPDNNLIYYLNSINLSEIFRCGSDTLTDSFSTENK